MQRPLKIILESMQEPPKPERQHHCYSPSSLQSREACPKFQSRNAESEASLRGTRQHNAVEGEQDDALLADHEAIAVAECVAFADNVAKRYPGGTVLKEVYLPVDDEEIVVRYADGGGDVFKGTTAGYPDFAVVSADGATAEIIDYKFGQHGVEAAENNLQGIAYMLGLAKKFPTIRTCKVQFVLPHRDEIDQHLFILTDENVLAYYTRVVAVVRRSEEAARVPDDFSMANPTLGACLFCSLIGKCPKVAETVLKIGQKFAPLQLPENVNPSLISDPADTSLGIKVAQIAEAWAKAFRAGATEKAISDPDFMPLGYVLVTSTRRIVRDARKLADIGKEFVPEAAAPEIEKLFDIPIGGIEGLIKLAAPRGLKEKTVDAFGEAAIARGALELGAPFAFLKQSTKNKTKKEQTNES